ncbi:hypothetical protein EKK58_10215 [Candidatus Dependentiae bacterium]|nr:MAG: hypothetical protein EKK58_10215 [Candidatus Dependentiae bacterium]
MQRPIEFRVWDSFNGKMIYVNFERLVDGEKPCDFRIYCHECFLDNTKPVVMQYTGLKDKNGVKIFEGDIVKYKPYHNLDYKEKYLIGEVKWGETGDSDEYSHSKHLEWVVNSDSLADIADGNYEGFDCEVIGNIYQNPELLRG